MTQPSMEVWGGVECTVRRAGEGYLDQIELSGHAGRPDDLARFAALGIRTLRYPVLWERAAPKGLLRADWSWSDERLGLLQQLGISPIVGLLHHGSGPRATSLIDPDFPQRLADYAHAVARRYPWVRRFTPINEPLTTARFSGLYGHWYPHGRDAATFARALINQCRGTVLAMRAIRAVVPAAELVQTEDLAKTYSTPRLAYQAVFENERRWVTFDLLCGRLARGGPVWGLLRESGITEAELEWFLENPLPPQILGLNYYVTSERFLDDRMDFYPECCRGGNSRDRYADVEAVRVRREGLAGFYGLLRETWDRYRLPMAVTEVHLGGSREAQLRWLAEAWHAAVRLRSESVDLRAITAWSLLGAFEWNSLLTREEGYYESGVFDIRGPEPRETALAAMLRELTAGRPPRHPVLGQPGWWRRPQRLFDWARPAEPCERDNPAGLSLVIQPEGATGGLPTHACSTLLDKPAVAPHLLDKPAVAPAGQPILITGATGTLGRAFAAVCRERGLPYRLLRRVEMDIAQPASVAAALAEFDPWAVVNAAGYVRVDEAEQDRWRCFRENSIGPAILAAACACQGVALLTFSSDLVFDGSCRRPYVESDGTAPLCFYGRSKVDAEQSVLEEYPAALVVRSSAFFGPWDTYSFLTESLARLAAGRRLAAASDTRVSPTYVPDLVNTCIDLLIDGQRGVWHLANSGEVTWYQFAGRAAEAAGICRAGLEGLPQHCLGQAARRPLYSVLGSERGRLLPPLEDAITRYVDSSRFRSVTFIREE